MPLIDELQAIVGADHVFTAPQDTAPYVVDWRRRFTGTALAVVRPRDTAAVARVVRACAHHGAPVVPQGGNTGLVGGGTPDSSGRAVLVSTRRLNRVRAIDTANDTITVEAGCILQRVQEAAAERDRLFPLSLAAQGSCTIGGNLATNAGGVQVLRYGNARELALGLEVVLPDGQVWDGLRGLRKDNTGYDLKHLFIGAEGTLGIITAATLRLYPLPRVRLTALAALPDLGRAVALMARARDRAGPLLTAFEVMSAACLQAVARELPGTRLPLPADDGWFALLELSDHEDDAHATALLEALLAAALEAGEVRDVVVARSLTESRTLWRLREDIPEAQRHAGGNIKHDIALPVSAIPAFVAATDAALRARFSWIQPIVFGHLGDGNLHYNMGGVPGTPLATVFAHEAAVQRLVNDAVQAHQGSISAEHGIGQLKRDLLPDYKSALELDLMRAIKAALDPTDRMNPGKLLATAAPSGDTVQAR
jgi:FAD/FMN-containing dehydrogenase